ncbi:DUF6542 domain-containing protein [Pseudonocardia sp. TRM90224]|uniref:DUF6542 domain-containing protein n=1 Tax=Pseudonocardia sp. TRM90224 TaxID=2812678 RepID=UPI001E3FAE6B|nr:DUF6542 domain-containing protein [Pseudonocardia sp. TRM90224]
MSERGRGAQRGKPGGGGIPVAERSLLPTVPGVAPLVAIGIGAGFTLLGVFADIARIGTLGLVFTICYVAGCVLAVAWVRRAAIFGPMVQPPLLLAVAVPIVVLLAGTPKPGAGVAERLLVIGAPLVNAFPTMAWTTGAVVLIGSVRMLLQRLGSEPTERERPDRSERAEREVSSRKRSPARDEEDGARAARRRPASPRRS